MHALCRWLADRTDLKLIVWTDEIPWPHRRTAPFSRVGRRLLDGVRRKGLLRAIDEAGYYGLYFLLLRPPEEARIRQLTGLLVRQVRSGLDSIEQRRPKRIHDVALFEQLRRLRLDAIFVSCIDVHLPPEITESPRLGAFLWHEGITPEYRGVYSHFWALDRGDYAGLGFTLLKMNERFDAGPIFVQGPLVGVDPGRDWHCYLATKSLLDSLPHVDRFLGELERNQHLPIDKSDAKDGFYSYPTASALLRIALRRRFARMTGSTSTA